MTTTEIFWLSPITDRYNLTSNNYFLEPKFNQSNEYAVARINKKVSEYFNIPLKEIKSMHRKRERVIARQFICLFLKNETSLSLKKIGEEIGGKDHTTVIHSINTINDLIITDEVIRRQFQDLQAMI